MVTNSKRVWIRLIFLINFEKIIIRHKRIGHDLNVMRRSPRLVIHPITVDYFAALFNCTPVDRCQTGCVFFWLKTAYAAASPASPLHRGISLAAYAGLHRSHARCNRAKSATVLTLKKNVPIEILVLPTGECLCSFLNALKALISMENKHQQSIFMTSENDQ